MNGKIVRIISNLYTVEIDSKRYECRARGILRKLGTTPLVGDNVVVDIDNNIILEIKKRHNLLERPPIANVNYALIMSSVVSPKLSLNLLDKQLSIISLNNIKPIIILTKLDLIDKEKQKEIEEIMKYYQKIGYQVFNNTQKNEILTLLKNKISVLTGQSGVGKSTLLNNFNENLNIKTQPISKSLGRGIHTTRHVELFAIEECLIADTPGFSSLNFEQYTHEELRDSFIEFNNFNCEFKNCMHINEQKCSIKEAVEKNEILKTRYENYIKFYQEVKK